MTEDLSNLPDLLERARAKCPRACATLHRAFNRYLLAVAGRCLSRRLRSKEDPEDVVQTVWREFFDRVPEPRRVPDAGRLRGWLAAITRRRACDVNRRFLKRPTHNVRLECPVAVHGRRSA